MSIIFNNTELFSTRVMSTLIIKVSEGMRYYGIKLSKLYVDSDDRVFILAIKDEIMDDHLKGFLDAIDYAKSMGLELLISDLSDFESEDSLYRLVSTVDNSNNNQTIQIDNLQPVIFNEVPQYRIPTRKSISEKDEMLNWKYNTTDELVLQGVGYANTFRR